MSADWIKSSASGWSGSRSNTRRIPYVVDRSTGQPSRFENQGPNIRRPQEVPVRSPRRGGDAFVHQSSTQVIGSSIQASLRL